MKKHLAMLLAVCLCMGMVACGGSDTSDPGKENPKQEDQQHGKDNVETTQGEAQDEFGYMHLVPLSILISEEKGMEVVRIGEEYFFRHTDEANNLHTILEP